MAEVLMPRLSDSMEEGVVLRWLIADGAAVKRGEEIVEIETDKATMIYEADADGVLAYIAGEGETLPVGAPIALIGDGGPPPITSLPGPAAPASVPSASATPSEALSRTKASPLARRTAAALGVDLAAVSGSGPYGRIRKADVEAAATAVAERGPTPTTAKGEVQVIELSRLQQTVARRMAESRATIPEFSLTGDVDFEAAVALRGQLKDEVELAPSLNDMLVRACGLALRRRPKVNGRFEQGRLELYERVNVGIAVAAEEALVVPTIFDADRSSLGAIASRARELAARVRDGSITPPELAGGTFTVSNLGMLGVDRFEGIINPGQAAILCVGALSERVVLDDEGRARARPMVSLTLVCDHRILYGADAAEFLAELRRLLEHPFELLL
jgi:pyruvate dehydrogenase E2 component (dihydrolipoyllysine-residue acetyltransferase)